VVDLGSTMSFLSPVLKSVDLPPGLLPINMASTSSKRTLPPELSIPVGVTEDVMLGFLEEEVDVADVVV
jgi:hypothetical protein